MTNVLPFANDMATRIKGELKKAEKHDAGWREATINLCLFLAEERDRHESNIAFGQWIDANSIDLDPNAEP